jgi:arginyl-tRNA synthetase
MIKQELKEEIAQKLKNKNIPEYTLEESPNNIPGDIGTNLAILLSRKTSRPINDVFEEIAKKLSDSKLIKKVEHVGPGFLNFYISEQRLYTELHTVNSLKESYPEINPGNGKKILLEFVSANPTGPLHIGHGRGAVIGDVLARLFSKSGYSVNTEYYINDTGNQIRILGDTVRLKCLKIMGIRNAMDEEKLLAEKGYKGKYIEDIAGNIIKEQNISNPEDIRTKYPRSFFAQKAYNIILGMIKEDLSKFNIKFDNWLSERSLYENKSVEKTLKSLVEKGVVYEKDDATWFKSTLYGDEKDRVLVRKTEHETYFANDVAYHRYKYDRGYERLINVWGADHHGYVRRIKAAIKALGYNENNLDIVLCQLVSLSRGGKPIAMSTREGKFIPLAEVIDEIGRDACRYFLLTRSPEAHIEFDLELAKKHSPENPVYYIQYAHTRCCGVLRQSSQCPAGNSAESINYSLLKLPQERELMKKILFYSEIIHLCIRNLSPHHLTAYLLDLSGIFHRYYDKYRIITEEKELTLARLNLVTAIKTVLNNGLSILGISAPEKM